MKRITINLDGETADLLDRLTAVSGHTLTKEINKAVQLYGWITELIEAGGALYVREFVGADLEKIVLVGITNKEERS